MGFQMSVLTLGIIAVQYVLNGLGSIAIAAYTTAVRVDQLASQSLLALGAAVATYTAQNFGAKKMSRIRDERKAAILLAARSEFCEKGLDAASMAEIARRGWQPTFICESAGTQAEDALVMKGLYEKALG